MTGVTFASTDPNNYPQVVESLDTLLLEQNIINTIFCVGFFIFVRSQPDKPPSLAALQQPKEKHFVPAFKAAV
jgi:hypothetical protein